MMPHLPASWLYLLLIPLVIAIRWWRARRATAAGDVWFEPEGANFIYQPFGRFGAAYLVTPSVRDAIRARLAAFARVAAAVVIIAAVGPILLLSVNADLYIEWRPQLVWFRLALVLALVPLGLVWRLVQVRPLYAGAPPAPRRITSQSIRAKRIAARSWWGLGLMLATSSFVAACFGYMAYVGSNPLMAVYGLVFLILASLNLRSLLAKRRLRGD